MPISRGDSRSSSGISNRRSNCNSDRYSSSSGCRKGSRHRPKGSPELSLGRLPPGRRGVLRALKLQQAHYGSEMPQLFLS
jgi:hypothetical protein